MSQDLTIDYLVVSRTDEPPAAPAIARALAAAGLGVADYTPAPEQAAGSGPLVGRRRVGTHTLAIAGTRATGRISVFRYGGAVTEGMGDSAFNALTRGLSPEDVRTLREGTVSVNLRVTTLRAQALAALGWAVRTLRVLADVAQGACIDPGAQRCYGRADLARLTADDALAHVAIHDDPWDAESRWLHTHGLQKLGSPEVDLVAVPHSLLKEARAFLGEVTASLAAGADLAAGGEIDMGDLGMVTAVGAVVDVDHQAPFGRLRLADVPMPGERQGVAATRLLRRMTLADAARHAAEGNVPGALQELERVLAADPDDCAALALQARLYLRQGHALDALAVGELMALRVPGDYRGPLVTGLALMALGRYSEALHALEQAIEREPEAAEAFAARAEAHERLGHERLAAVDRAHAAYLGG
jgi:tetratricopeptide (TPR) repeat protein